MSKFGALAAIFLVAATLPAGNLKTPRADYGPFEKKLSKDRSIVHALNRLAFGPRPGDVEAVKRMGLEKWIDLQLHPERIAVYVPPGAALPPPQEKILRAIYSNRQLEEVLADFWYNHFNVDISKGADRRLVPAYEHDAIRPNVLGKFRDLLGATANSPAMLFYLDNWQSIAPDQVRRPNGKRPSRGLNENYARELMELHTLGVDGGYTQQDIIEVARCFTGWTIDRPNQDGAGTFLYDDRAHDKGEKVVLGVTIPAGGGKDDGEKVLDILARHPSTANFISMELARRFVADDPPPALIAHMAETFRSTDGDIRAVLATMFSARELFSQGAYRAKVKTPFETVVSAARATGAHVDSAVGLANQTATLGQPLYRKIEPTGYSDAGAEWVSSSALLARMNFAMQLGSNGVQGVQMDANRFSKDPAVAARQILSTDASSQTLQSIRKNRVLEKPVLIGLLLGSPEFQRR
jgi:uncharacterized protein (DUF1800 family)